MFVIEMIWILNQINFKYSMSKYKTNSIEKTKLDSYNCFFSEIREVSHSSLHKAQISEI